MFLIEEMLKLDMSMICGRSGQSKQPALGIGRSWPGCTNSKPSSSTSRSTNRRPGCAAKAATLNRLTTATPPNWTARHSTNFADRLQAPVGERVIVVAGSHDFNSQSQTILRRLLEMQILPADTSLVKDIPKPGLINLVALQESPKKPARR